MIRHFSCTKKFKNHFISKLAKAQGNRHAHSLLRNKNKLSGKWHSSLSTCEHPLLNNAPACSLASLTLLEKGSAHEMLTYMRRAKHVTYAELCGTGPQSQYWRGWGTGSWRLASVPQWGLSQDKKVFLMTKALEKCVNREKNPDTVMMRLRQGQKHTRMEMITEPKRWSPEGAQFLPRLLTWNSKDWEFRLTETAA